MEQVQIVCGTSNIKCQECAEDEEVRLVKGKSMVHLCKKCLVNIVFDRLGMEKVIIK